MVFDGKVLSFEGAALLPAKQVAFDIARTAARVAVAAASQLIDSVEQQCSVRLLFFQSAVVQE